MRKKRPVETPEDLVHALDELFNQVMMDVPDELDDILREAGYNPEKLGQDLAEYARQVSANSPLDWRNKQSVVEQAKNLLRSASQSLNLSRSQKEARLNELFAEQQRLGFSVAHRNYIELTDQDLDSLLMHTEYLLREQNDKSDTSADGE